MRCNKCGAYNPEKNDLKACLSCGAELSPIDIAQEKSSESNLRQENIKTPEQAIDGLNAHSQSDYRSYAVLSFFSASLVASFLKALSIYKPGTNNLFFFLVVVTALFCVGLLIATLVLWWIYLWAIKRKNKKLREIYSVISISAIVGLIFQIGLLYPVFTFLFFWFFSKSDKKTSSSAFQKPMNDGSISKQPEGKNFVVVEEGKGSKICQTCGEKNNPSFSKCWKCSSDIEKGVVTRKNNDVKCASKGSWAKVVCVIFIILFAIGLCIVQGLNHGNPVLLFIRASVNSSLGRPDAALVDLNKAITIDPKMAGYHALRGTVYFLKGDYDRAIEDFDEAINSDSKHDGYFKGRGSAYLEKGDYDHAISDFNEGIKIEPNKGSFYYLRGLAYLKKGDKINGSEDINKAETLGVSGAANKAVEYMQSSKTPSKSLNKISTNAQTGKIQEKLEHSFKSITERTPTLTELLGIRTAMHAILDVNAISTTVRSGDVPSNAKEAAAAYQQGLNYFSRQQQYGAALTAYNKAIELNPTRAEYFFQRGSVYLVMEKYNEAEADLNQALALAPESFVVFSQRGLVYYSKGEYDKSISDYGNAIKIKPQESYNYYQRGRSFMLKEEYEAATEDFSNAIKLKPDFADTYLQRGVAFLKKNDTENGLKDIRKAEELGSEKAKSLLEGFSSEKK